MIVSNPRLSKQLKNKSLWRNGETAPKCDLFLVWFGVFFGGGSINLKFVFSGSSLVYSEKYFKKPTLVPTPPPPP
jgi:hypothetical protein